jgi:hypothetical protein
MPETASFASLEFHTFAWRCLLSAFRQAGFAEVSRPSERRAVVRPSATGC